MSTYADDAPCGRCGKPVHLLHDAPCEHGEVACPECTHAAVCALCSVAAEAEMHADGEYDPRKDPFFDHTADDTHDDRVPTWYGGIPLRKASE